MTRAKYTPLEELFDALIGPNLELRASIYGSRAEEFKRILELRLFSRLVATYEESSLSVPGYFPDELKHAITGLAMQRGAEESFSFYSPPALEITSATRLLQSYYSLPPEHQPVAAERSNELIAHKHRARVVDHELIWSSELPVGYISSNPESESPYHAGSVSILEYAVYAKGHDSSLAGEYGSQVLELLDTGELAEAVRLLKHYHPGRKLRELSNLAAFKADSMSSELLLKLLRLGYGSPAQLRRAAKALGITSWNRSYFDQILAGGSALAFAVA